MRNEEELDSLPPPTDTISIVLQWSGNSSVENFTQSATVMDLKDRIMSLSQIKPEHQKLISRGKRISAAANTTLLTDLGLDTGSKVMVLGSTAEEIDELAHGVEREEQERLRKRERGVVNDLDWDFYAASSFASGTRDRPRNWEGRMFGFQGVRTLPGLPQEDKAKQLLEELAADPGILGVMNKHRWNVGMLSEMYPEGYVGVSEVCVLGLNVNKGQEIKLRLRTDDLSGFRKRQVILKTLYHELAHNVFSEHDQHFYQLMRQIENEAGELDLDNSGHRLGGTWVPPRMARRNVGPNFTGGSGRLGHAVDTHSICDHCGQTVDIPGMSRCQSCVPLAQSPSQQLDPATATTPLESNNALQGTNPKPKESPPTSEILEEFPNQLVSMGFDPNSVTRALQKVDGNMEAALELLLSGEPIEDSSNYGNPVDPREARILNESARLRKEVREGEWEATRDTLVGLLQQIMHDPDEPKWKRVRKMNKRFTRTVGKYPAGLRFLKELGFHDNGDGFLVLKRCDTGLLWFGMSAVQSRNLENSPP